MYVVFECVLYLNVHSNLFQEFNFSIRTGHRKIFRTNRGFAVVSKEKILPGHKLEILHL